MIQVSTNELSGLERELVAMCPMCSGPGVLLGSLGRLNHFRCRNCGWDFSEEPLEEDSSRDRSPQAVASDAGIPASARKRRVVR